ncbi:16S rRNA (guanine(966)-N(2))-methyltransferase RsmD [Candidatus Sumerlaeota bacterium]|nr:16S rRNA (guanine(966)-N(2))-methyltransferase RsmD [Candidatus Sumerlaeota bacterium]
MIRIISGERRGAKIATPDGEATRPLRDRIREALFNALRADLRGAIVLDAFAGSGAVGFEALSNGAARASFIENDRKALQVIRANAQKLRYEDRAQIIEGTSPEAIAGLPPGQSFNLLFLMPPYHSGLCESVLNDNRVAGQLATGAIAVCEIHKDEKFEIPAGWTITKDKQYGITRLVFLAGK